MPDELLTGALPGPEEQKDREREEGTEKKPRGRAAVKIRMASLETEVEDRIREYVAIPIGMMSPLGCAVLDQRAERTSKALCRIAATSPKMRKALERFVQGSAVADLGGTMIAVTIAIGVDMHRFDPQSMPARYAGIPKVWNDVYPDIPPENWIISTNGNGDDAGLRGFAFGEESP